MNRSSQSQLASILVVDDHGIVCEGIAALLDRQDDMKVVGFAASGREAILAAARLEPGVIIMDLVLPDINGIDATERILRRQPRTKVVVLSACHTTEHVYRALRAGAQGYVVKHAAADELVRAVRAVWAHKQFLSPGITSSVIDSTLSYSLPKSPLQRLSFREREVLHRIVAGSSSVDIALHLSLSRKTVDTYRARMMAKLGVRNRSALIRFAIEHELAAP